VRLHGRRIVPSPQWSRPARNVFVVEPGGLVRDQWALPGMLQGNLHRSLRNPPRFLVNMPRGGMMQVHVRAVATLGARLQWTIDGKTETPIDLPDRDGKNDALAHEYDRTFDLAIPPWPPHDRPRQCGRRLGLHRLVRLRGQEPVGVRREAWGVEER